MKAKKNVHGKVEKKSVWRSFKDSKSTCMQLRGVRGFENNILMTSRKNPLYQCKSKHYISLKTKCHSAIIYVIH